MNALSILLFSLFAASAPAISPELSSTSTQLLEAEVRARFVGWPRADFLSCSRIVLDSTKHKFPVSCSLLSKPSSNVVVFLEAYGLTFSTCNLVFSSSNWSTPQQFNVNPVPDLFASLQQTQLSIFALAESSTESFTNKTQVLLVTKPAASNRQPVSCSIVGDPHIFAFDSDASVVARTGKRAVHFDFYSTGVYYLVESSAGLRVLGSYFDCAQGLTCLGGVSVQYGESVYVVSVESKQKTDSLKIASIGKSTAGTSYTIDKQSRQMKISLEDGTVIHITYGNANGVIAFDVLLSPIHYQKVGGHCHYFDDSLSPEKLYCYGKTWNKWKKDGEWFDEKSVDAWGRCWAVKEFDNVFKGKVGRLQGSAMVDVTVPLSCRVPDIRVAVQPQTPAPAPPAYNPCDFKNGGCDVSVVLITSSSASLVSSTLLTGLFLLSLASDLIVISSTLAPSSTDQSTPTVITSPPSTVQSTSTDRTSPSSTVQSTSTDRTSPSSTAQSTSTDRTSSFSIVQFTMPVTSTSIPSIVRTSNSLSSTSITQTTASTTQSPIYAPYIFEQIVTSTSTSICTSSVSSTASSSTPCTSTTHSILVHTTTTLAQSQPTLHTLVIPQRAYAPICIIKQSDALSWCTKSIQEVQGCTELCNRSQFIQMCITDVLSVCSYLFCDDFKNAYIRQCAVKSTLLVNHPKAEYAVLAVKVQASIGFGQFECKEACGRNGGVCGGYGCVCPDGRSGLDCAVDLKMAVHYNSVGLFAASGDHQLIHSVLVDGNASVYQAAPQFAVSWSVQCQSITATLALVFVSSVMLTL